MANDFVKMDTSGEPTITTTSANVISYPRRGVIPALRDAICTIVPYCVRYCGQGQDVTVHYIDRAEVLRILAAIEQAQ